MKEQTKKKIVCHCCFTKLEEETPDGTCKACAQYLIDIRKNPIPTKIKIDKDGIYLHTYDGYSGGCINYISGIYSIILDFKNKKLNTKKVTT